jgi:hypothetical protein
MTKNEQNRVVNWRLKILRQASELPRGVSQNVTDVPGTDRD